VPFTRPATAYGLHIMCRLHIFSLMS